MDTQNLNQMTQMLGNQQHQIQQLTNTVQSQMHTYLPFISIIVVLGFIFYIVNMIQKWRFHHAVIRIDHNVQKLVDIVSVDPPRAHHGNYRDQPAQTEETSTKEDHRPTSD